MGTLHGEGGLERKIAGFWRCLGAFVIDLVLLGIAGMILGALLFDTSARMGAHARLIGLAIAQAYFGICNSRIGDGQPLGKRWLGVRVVDAHDQLLSLPRSLLRYAVLGIPFFANGLPLSPTLVMSTPLGYLLARTMGEHCDTAPSGRTIWNFFTAYWEPLVNSRGQSPFYRGDSVADALPNRLGTLPSVAALPDS